MKEFKEWFKSLTPVQQIIFIVVVLIVLYVVISRSKSYLSALGDNAAVKGEINAYQTQGQKLSYPISQYNSFASTLYNADGDAWYTWLWANIGTNDDETAIYSVFNAMNNDLDVIQLELAYKDLSGGYTMEDYLNDVFYRPEIEEINKVYASKGIKRRY